MAVITMTREMGTLGKEVARIFARKSGFRVIHHELVEASSDRKRRGRESEVFRFLEGSREELNRWRGNADGGGYLTAEDIIQTALEGDVLIRGWGASRLLRAVPNVLSVRVCAPMKRRIAEMMRRLDIDEPSARREIARNDGIHSGIFSRFFMGKDWRDPLNYDLVLNTDHLDPEHCAQLLLDALDAADFAESPASRKVLEDRLLQARVAARFADDPVRADDARNIHVAVVDGHLRLYGVVHSGDARDRAEQMLAAQTGLRSVQNELISARSFYR